MIPFEEIDARLAALGKDRKWLAEVTGRSEGSIRAALAPNSAPKNRTALLQKALTDAIEAAEKQGAELVPDQVTLTASHEEFDAWRRAYKASDSDTLKEWAIDALNQAAYRAARFCEK